MLTRVFGAADGAPTGQLDDLFESLRHRILEAVTGIDQPAPRASVTAFASARATFETSC